MVKSWLICLNSRMKFENANVLITGGSSGIGKATAALLVKMGANVFLAARGEQRLEQTVSELRAFAKPPQKVVYLSTDISQFEQAKKTVIEAESQLGSIDLLINSAGISKPGYVQELSLQSFENQMQVNYLGTVYMVKAVLPKMMERKVGWIANVSSVVGLKGFFGHTGYSASKFAVIGFSEALAIEIRRFCLGVSVLCPPDTQTPMLEQEVSNRPIEVKRMSEQGTILSPEQVAEALIAGIRKKRFLIIPGWGGKALYILNRLSPSFLNWNLRRIGSPNKRKGIKTYGNIEKRN